MSHVVATQLLDPTPPERVLWDVVAEHLDEGEFLLVQWDAACRSIHYTVDEVAATLEPRLICHIEGLVVGGRAVAERLLRPEIEEVRDIDRTTVAALALLWAGEAGRWQEVLDALLFAHEDRLRRGLTRAVTLFPDPAFDAALLDALEAARLPREQALLLDLCAARCIDPGEHLEDCFDTGFDLLDAAALRSAGRAGRHDVLDQVEERLGSDVPALREAAVEAGLALGSSAAWVACRDLATRTGPFSARALLLTALLGGLESRDLVLRQLEREETRDAALRAAGFTGSIECAERCVPILECRDARTAKLAAEAIAGVTGLPLLRDPSLHAPAAASDDGFPPLELDDLDADLVPDAVDEIPRPDPQAIATWLAASRGRFASDVRYLEGQPCSAPALAHALAVAPMRRRHALALELLLRSGAKRVVATHGLARAQLEQVQALADLQDAELVNRFGGA